MTWSLTMTQDRVLKNQDLKEGILKFHFFSKNVSLNLNYTFFDKHQFHKQHQAEIGKNQAKAKQNREAELLSGRKLVFVIHVVI